MVTESSLTAEVLPKGLPRKPLTPFNCPKSVLWSPVIPSLHLLSPSQTLLISYSKLISTPTTQQDPPSTHNPVRLLTSSEIIKRLLRNLLDHQLTSTISLPSHPTINFHPLYLPLPKPTPPTSPRCPKEDAVSRFECLQNILDDEVRQD
jgi:hypothetical protein